MLTLAVLLSYADGFWLTSLRGAVGAIERTQSPFTSWLRESTLLLPVFVLAVLLALTLSLRWFGPEQRRGRTALAAVLVVAASTLAGLAEIVASAAYDYRLQTTHLQHMDSMRSLCTSTCLAQAQDKTLAVHLHGVLYVGRWLLLTNAVLVLWALALMGGHLAVSRLRAHRSVERTTSTGSPTADWGIAKLTLTGALLAAAVVHLAVVPQHLSEWPTAGMFFVLLALWQAAAAGLLITGLDDAVVLVSAAALSVGPLVLWFVSRAWGLPFGPDAGLPEPVGLADIAAGLAEVASLVAAVALLRARRPARAASAHGRALVVVALVAVTAVGAAGSGIAQLDAFGIAQASGHAHH